MAALKTSGSPVASRGRTRTNIFVVSSGFIGGAIALALLMRPSHSPRREVELPVAVRIPPSARAAIAGKMHRHAEQLPALVSRVVLLDYDGVARTAGEIFDEPGLARPVSGNELSGLLPERYFALQEQLQAAARLVVAAAARQDGHEMAAAFGDLTRICVDCHAVYLSGQP